MDVAIGGSGVWVGSSGVLVGGLGVMVGGILMIMGDRVFDSIAVGIRVSLHMGTGGDVSVERISMGC